MPILKFKGLPEPSTLTLKVSGKRSAATITADFGGVHIAADDLKTDLTLQYGDADWHIFGVETYNRRNSRGALSTDITAQVGPYKLNAVRKARSNDLLYNQLKTDLLRMLYAVNRVGVNAEGDFDAASSSQIGYWNYILTGDEQAAMLSVLPLYKVISSSIVGLAAGTFDDLTSELYEKFSIITIVDLDYVTDTKPSMRLFCVLSPPATPGTAIDDELIDFTEYGNLSVRPQELIQVGYRLADGTQLQTYTELPALPPADANTLFGTLPTRETSDTDASYLQKVNDSMYISPIAMPTPQAARLEAELQQHIKYRANRLASATLVAPDTFAEFEAYLPGKAVSVSGVNYWILETSITGNPANTLTLDLYRPLSVAGRSQA